MTPDYLKIGPWLLGILALFVIYRRLRGQFGRQPLKPVRMGVRVTLLLALAAVLAPIAFGSTRGTLLALGGLALGAALGAWAAAHTRITSEAGQSYYTPHTVAGMLVMGLLLARLAYRFIILQQAGVGVGAGAGAHAAGASPDHAAAMMQAPANLGLFFLVVGYYVCYYARVLWKSRQVPADLTALS